MSELKPCPFCGGKAIGAPSCRPEWVYEIKCTDCGAKIKKLAICPSCARREAIEAWNTRAERTCIVLEEFGGDYVCDACGEVLRSGYDDPFEAIPLERFKYCFGCGAKVVE
jgi:Lar family restriction alleviation protein